MDPRKLVGMTRGARVRAARREAFLEVDIYCEGYLTEADRPAYAAAYSTIRAAYRIGQRLRPCPGCQRCTRSPVRFSRLPRGYTVIVEFDKRYYATSGAFTGWSAVPTEDGGWQHASSFVRAQAVFNGRDRVTIVDAGQRACDGSGVLPARERPPRRRKPCITITFVDEATPALKMAIQAIDEIQRGRRRG